MSIVLDGFKVAKEIRNRITLDTKQLKEAGHRVPCLAVVLVGSDQASLTYVNSKEKQAHQVGFDSKVIKLDESSSQDEIEKIITSLNSDENVDGILVQLPLPKHIDEDRIIDLIDPSKDVDGLTPYNVAMLSLGKTGLRPCTPQGIVTLLDYYNINLEGAKVLIIGRSRLVGKPLLSMLLSRNATVTISHSKTKNLDLEIENNDIIVVAIGSKEFIKTSSIKASQVIIDVGIHRNEDGSLSGDIEHDAYTKAAYASPVPKGVGPMTIASLLENTLIAYKRRVKL